MGSYATDVFGAMPRPETLAGLSWIRNLLGYRVGYQIADQDSIYIDYNAAGDGTGGGGAGTTASPYLCATVQHVKTLTDSLLSASGNKSFVFKMDDVFRTSGGTANLMNLDFSNCSIDQRGTGTLPPIFTGFELCGDTFVSDAGAYYKVLGYAPYWVRLTGNHAGLIAGTETAYIKADSKANCQATNNSWFYESGTGRTYIRHGAGTDPSSLFEACRNDGYGVRMADVDGLHCHGIAVIGFGMNDADGSYNIQSFATGTNEHLVSCCYCYYGPKHQIGHINSSGVTAGGIFTDYQNKFGLGVADVSNGYTGSVGYANLGGHEYIISEFDCQYGALPQLPYATAPNRRGQPYYAHTGSNTVRLAIAYKGITRDHTSGCQTDGGFGNLPDYTTNREKTDEYRGVIAGTDFEQMSATPTTTSYTAPSANKWLNTVNLWCRERTKQKTDVGAGPIIGNASVQKKAAFIGHTWVMNSEDASGVASLSIATDNSDQYVDFAHCHLALEGLAAKQNAYDHRTVSAPYKQPRNRVYNSIVSSKSSANSQAFHMHPNAACIATASATADGSLTGGGRVNAYWRLGTTNGTHTIYGPSNFSADYLGVSSVTSYITLTALPTVGAIPAAGDLIYRTAGSTPYSIEWWMEPNGTPQAFPSVSNVGPVQTNGTLYPAKSSIASLLLLDLI